MKTVFLVSRNKDNKNIKDFKERKQTFLFDNCPLLIRKKFIRFVKEGLPNEFSRLYISVNERDMEKTRTAFICELVKNKDLNLTHIENKLVSLAQMSENALTKKWLFDFDCDNEVLVDEFIKDVLTFSGLAENQVQCFKSPNGFAIIVSRGFDTRELLTKWKDMVSLKRDDMLILDWQKNIF